MIAWMRNLILTLVSSLQSENGDCEANSKFRLPSHLVLFAFGNMYESEVDCIVCVFA